ncbi:GntR family transcriptional regulator [Leucobacter tenebrionis]|uniref:GntR family transcriptional regulator n=1 Tax=Leucobacter tenebrionis TaxID=2873270 RepID=UPI001CA76B6A|nr:GntR family transcriptional regulator [Leucobacter tenebrionis]QZY50991.1 GntR family transcriptional regulator [Leucobacter tenebrionis]
MFDDTRPIFQQLADRIADDVLRGVYAEEEQVPSTNELAAHLRINPATAGKGLNLLVERGVLYKRRGIGMFVAPGARSLIAGERQQAFVQRFIVPLLAEARNLGLDARDVVGLIEQQADPQAGPEATQPQAERRAEQQTEPQVVAHPAAQQAKEEQ